MPAPKITVCIPTYNYGRYLPQAVESVLCQSLADFELLVIDDCSTDETDQVMRRFAERDGRVRYLRNAGNLGMVRNWNRCLGEARGEYVKFLFADDLLHSREALARMAAVLDADRSVSLVGSARHVVDAESRIVTTWSHFKAGTFAGTPVINSCLYQQKNLIGEPSAVMFRRSMAGRGFAEKYRQWVDLEMWFHLLEQGRFAYIEEPLCAFRVHPDQQTAKNRECSETADDALCLSRDYLDKPYIVLSAFTRKYLVYHYWYRIWKAYRSRLSGTGDAVAKIDGGYGIRRFLLFLPFYKLAKPFFKLFRSIRGLLDG